MSQQPRQEEQCYNWEPATLQLETESIRVQGCQEEWETWLNIFPNTSPTVPCDESAKTQDSEPDVESISGGNTNEIAPVVVDEGKTRRNTWTTAEHKRFLTGLKEYGKKWTRISRDFVVTKSPSQVASHAQKYFLRQRATTEQRKRESIHDITPDNNDLVHQPQPQIKEALLHNVSRIVPGHVELPILVDDLKEEEEEEVTTAEMLEEEMIAIELDDGVRKGKPWTGEEHWLFLVGLEEFGKGKWTSISRYWVVSRTPSQVASHAQKYFLRQSRKERKRKSIHDITIESNDLVPELHRQHHSQHQSQSQFQPRPQSRPRCISHGQLGCLFCEKKNGL